MIRRLASEVGGLECLRGEPGLAGACLAAPCASGDRRPITECRESDALRATDSGHRRWRPRTPGATTLGGDGLAHLTLQFAET